MTQVNNAGTYNYYPASDPIGHIDYDVDTWMDYGSGPGDDLPWIMP